jgi:hypothetical protein
MQTSSKLNYTKNDKNPDEYLKKKQDSAQMRFELKFGS